MLPTDADNGSRRFSTRRVLIGVLLTATVLVVAFALSSGSNEPEPTRRADGSSYLIRTGDTIASVADLHGVSIDRLLEANGLTLSDSLDPDTRLGIPELSTDGRSPPRSLLGDDNKLAYEPLFEEATAENDLPPGLLEALAWHESEWVHAVAGDDGRVGLTQLPPEIVTFLRRDVVDSPLDPRRPEDNVALAGAYLGHLLDLADGDRAAALAGYYRGLETQAGGTWNLDIVGYVRAVLTLAPDFAGSVAPPAATSSTTAPA